jgi:MarR family transcriptional regulator, transcriptional regulator for hemolysin
MPVDHSFAYLVNDVARLFVARFNERTLSVIGLTLAQCQIIGCLASHEGVNQAGLAELLDIRPMTLVRQIDRMEEDGWVQRRPDPGDRRARQLQLTDKTRPVVARIRQLSSEVRREAFVGLSEADERILLSLLRRVHGNLAEPAGLPLLATPPLAAGPASQEDERGAQAGAGWLAAGDRQ